MIRKSLCVLTALSVLLLLSVKFNTMKREAIQLSIDEPEFSYQDFARKICLAGTWNGKEYVLKVKFKSLEVGLKVVFKGNIRSDVKFSSHSKQDNGRVDEFPICTGPRNGTHPHVYENSYEPDPRMSVMQTWYKVKGATVALASWTLNGVTNAGKTSFNITVTAAGKAYDWVISKAQSTWNEGRRLAKETLNGVMCVAKETWNGMTRLAAKTWDGIKYLTDRTWCMVTWIVEWVWDQVMWLIGPINFMTEVISVFYADYLKDYVSFIKSFIEDITWLDIFRACVLCSILLSLSLLVNYVIRQRRLTRMEREAAALKAATPKKPKGRYQQPKRKKKNWL